MELSATSEADLSSFPAHGRGGFSQIAVENGVCGARERCSCSEFCVDSWRGIGHATTAPLVMEYASGRQGSSGSDGSPVQDQPRPALHVAVAE